MAVTATVAAVVTAATAVTEGVMNYQAAKSAAHAQDDLKNQQAAQLKSEQDAAAELAAKQATMGSTFGTDPVHKVAVTGLGFDGGAGGTGNTGFGGRGSFIGGLS
jgi:hypothetical protein